jgi:hypothetical protein
VAEFIPQAGGSIVSRRVLDGTSALKWMFREESVNPVDNGWRFLGIDDDEDFINDPANMVVADFNTVAEIEPAIIPIWSLPVGSDLQLVVQDGRRTVYDNATGQPAELP